MPRPRTFVLPRPLRSPATAQLVALAAVAGIGTSAILASASSTGAVTSSASATTAAVASPSPRPATVRPYASLDLPALVAHAAAAKPAAKPAPKRAVAHHASHRRWLPTGTGMWIYEWKKTNGGNAGAVVRKARAAGLTTLFVRTGSSHDGFTGAGVLQALLPATRGTGLHVVAWDFPELKRPVADARRLAHAVSLRVAGVRVAAVAPDIETRSEGTHSSPQRVKAYLRALRRLLPRNVAILSTIPWPSQERIGRYPYGTVANYSDALLPMAYWYNNPPSLVTARSIARLRHYHRPIMPVGQGYDGKLDVPSLPHNNLKRQVPSFFATAHAMGAPAVSLWSWQAAPGVSWWAISRARHWFPVHR